MFFAKIPRHTKQNAITEGDLECIFARNCEGTEQLQKPIHNIITNLTTKYQFYTQKSPLVQEYDQRVQIKGKNC